MHTLRFSNPDFTPTPDQPGGDWTVEKMTWLALGGPDEAWARCETGRAGAAGSWAELLRRPVEIAGPSGELAWWGYVETVELRAGGGLFCFSLAGTANTVRYTYTDPAGETQVKSLSDLPSVEKYGVKEALITLELANSPRADTLARSVLQARSSVLGPWQTGLPDAPASVRLGLRGWWHTLGWRYFFYTGQGNAVSLDRWTQNGTANLGASTANQKAAQAMLDSSADYPAWNPVEVEFQASVAGAPVDKLRVAIFALDASNNPTGPALDQVDVTISGTALATYRVLLNRTAAVTPGTLFGVQFSRSGAVNSTNYFRLGTYDLTSGLPYPLKYWTGSAWAARSPLGTALVKVYGSAEITALVKFYAAKNQGGPFFESVAAQDLSGLSSSSLRNQVYSYQAEIQDLLGAGCADGCRLLAQVTPARVLTVFKTKPAAEPDLIIREDGQFVDLSGPVPAGKAVGRWARYAAWPDLPPVWIARE